MADDSNRVHVGDSAQPEAVDSEQQVSTHSSQPEAATADLAGGPPGEPGEFSAQPDAMELLEKSLQPDAMRPALDPGGVGASTQPEAIPLTTQQASPPPADED